MQVDARKLDEQELFEKLKEILSSKRACGEISIEILVGTSAEANKIKAFASMTGCQTESVKEGDHFKVRLKGSPCCT